MLCIVYDQLFLRIADVVQRIIRESDQNSTVKSCEVSLLKITAVMYLVPAISPYVISLCDTVEECGLEEALKTRIVNSYMKQVDRMVSFHILEMGREDLPQLSFAEVDRILDQM